MTNIQDTRTNALIEYLYDIIDTLVTNKDYEIKADFLDNDINSYSVDKVPTERTVVKWITGERICQDTYTFRSRFTYSSDQAEELNNIGFWESFEKIIEYKDKSKVLPRIDNIQSIECLNCGSLNYADETTCEMNIQIRIKYIEDNIEENISL